MKLYKTKKNCGKLLLGILAFCTGMILLTGCGSSSEQKQNKNEETAEENKEEDKVQIGLTVDSFVKERFPPTSSPLTFPSWIVIYFSFSGPNFKLPSRNLFKACL